MSGVRARVLTPEGRGAIAVVEVTGRGAQEMVSRRFRSRARDGLHEAPIDAIRYGHWRHEGEATGIAEEVVVVRTAPHRIEVHCHGGHAAPAAILASLASLGVAIDGGDRTAADGAPADTLEADALRLAQSALTERVAAVLLDQASGALRRAVDSIRERCETHAWAAAAEELEGLLRYAAFPDRAARPARVVLAGAPNSGKSSLINALLGFERAIVFDAPGTTRDVITAATAIDGWPVTLADTAGVRSTGDPLEAAGVRLAEQTIATADVVLRVREAAAFSDESPTFDAPSTVIDVASKADLASEFVPSPGVITTSVVDGRGVAGLLEAIAAELGPAAPPGAAAPFRSEHLVRLRDALSAAQRHDGEAAVAALRALLAGA